MSRSADGKSYLLNIPAAETKAGRDIAAALPRQLAQRLERHIAVHLPRLRTGARSGFLFPGGTSGWIVPSNLSKRITTLVQNQVGAQFNVHLVRHLVATMLLDQDPRNMPLVQRVLDHGSQKTSERWYGMQRSRGAQLAWMETLRAATVKGATR